MNSKLIVTVHSDVKDGLEALAKATNRTQSEIVEQALRLILDPVPVLIEARALLVAHQQERIILADKIDLLADALVDRMRANDRAEQDA